MGVSIRSPNFPLTDRFLKRANQATHSYLFDILDRYAKEGCDQLSSVTPRRTGLTANSWNYDIEIKGTQAIVYFNNDNVVKGVNIALIIQYGHGTRNGGYVEGIDYLNDPSKDIFNKMVEAIWREVSNL